MKKFTYNVIILSAGESSRMGFPKALLETGDGRKFIERILDEVKNITISPEKVIIVLGYHKDKILQEIDAGQYSVVINPAPENGQLSSLICGLQEVDEDCRGILLCLVDHPLVEKETYERIIEYAHKNPGSLILPRYGKRKGHPVFFPREIFDDLKESPLDQGARYGVRKNRERIIVIEVDDPGILKDIDTREDYSREVG